MKAPDNPFFARTLVNRIWAHYFGVGIVHPVDDFSLGNPPSNEQLLDALAKDFVEHKFDIRHIERVVLQQPDLSAQRQGQRHEQVRHATITPTPTSAR